jgi:uncharacterized protein (TIGR00730 family)
MGPLRRVCVFCASSPGARGSYATAAEAVGAVLARHGVGLVYGGGAVGLMGTLADAALAAGGEVTGVIPASLVAREVGHRGLSDLRVVASMHERKALMEELADGFVALPGGSGTLDELMEIVTWAQLGLHRKPIGLLDVDGYFEHLTAFLDHAVAERFVRPEHRELLLHDTDAEALLERMAAWEPVAVPTWIDRTGS